MTRDFVLERLAEAICSVRTGHPVRVAVDGIDCAGKTTLADELVSRLQPSGRPVLRVSIDGFHHPRRIRYQRGRYSPDGYFRDSFDFESILTCVLRPLGPGGDLRFRDACFDFRADRPVDAAWRQAAPEAMLLFDGVFLLRPELQAHWDYRVFMHVDVDVALARARARDLQLLGSLKNVDHLYRTRYIPGYMLYLDKVKPERLADVVIDNSDPEKPVMAFKNNREGVLIRPMTPGDWPAVKAIYDQGIATGDATFETTVPEWEPWDEDHLKAGRQVAVLDDRIVGWAALSPVSDRCAYAGVAEVSVYVAAEAHRQGLGRQLLTALVSASEAAGIWTLQAGIFPENQASITLHERCGFRIVGRRERLGKLAGRWRDVLMLERRSGSVGI